MTLLIRSCQKCREPLVEGANFCVACGSPAETTKPPSIPDVKTRKSALKGLLVLLVSLLGIAGGVALFLTTKSSVGIDATDSSAPVSASSSVTKQTNQPDAVADLNPAQLASAYGDAVFRVETVGCGLEGVGSAFAISDHQLITNWHVVVNDVTPVLRSRDGTTTLNGRVIGWSEDPDIAVIEVLPKLEVQVEWADSSELSEGEQLASFGYPLPDHEFSVIPGSVLSFVREGTRRVAVRTDASVDRGSSGGPALTPSGTVAGVVTAIDLNLEGFQYVPLIVTYDALAGTVENILGDRDRPSPDCVAANDLADEEATRAPADSPAPTYVSYFKTPIAETSQPRFARIDRTTGSRERESS